MRMMRRRAGSAHRRRAVLGLRVTDDEAKALDEQAKRLGVPAATCLYLAIQACGIFTSTDEEWDRILAASPETV